MATIQAHPDWLTVLQPTPMRGLPGGRADALPEYATYRDTGCDLHPRCLSCPLPRCRYDEPGGVRGIRNEARDAAIIALHRRGRLSVNTIAQRFGVSRRTVFRVLACHRSAPQAA